MTNYFFVAPNGVAGAGYLVTNGQAFAAESGSGKGLYRLPEGSYKLHDPAVTSEKGMVPPGKKAGKKWRLVGVGPLEHGQFRDGTPRIWDKIKDEDRKGLLVHYDGSQTKKTDGDGTAGCIGYKDPAAEAVFGQAVEAGDRDLEVVYVKDLAEAKAKAAEHAEGRVPNFGGKVSRISGGPILSEGDPTVLVGKNKRRAAHREAKHSGGGAVSDGSQNAFVGQKKQPLGRVEDPTTDGTQIQSGEPTVEAGTTKRSRKRGRRRR